MKIALEELKEESESGKLEAGIPPATRTTLSPCHRIWPLGFSHR